MKLFKSPGAIEDSIRHLRKAERYRREDRAIVSNFFNGAPPLTDEEAQDLGFTINVNHLFGFQELTTASDQIFGLYTKPASLVEIDLDAAPPGKRLLWSMGVTSDASRVFRKIEGFKTAYQGVSGDGAMHGEGLFFFPNTTFPLPKQCPLSRMLVPDDSSTDVRELSHFGIEHFLSLVDLRHYWETAPKGWKGPALQAVMAKIYEGSMTEGNAIHPSNFEEAEYRRQENSAIGYQNTARRRPGVEVVYFYQQRADLPGYPYDLTIKVNCEADSLDKGAILYEGEGVIPGIQKCLHPFFMDCIIGGAPKWHRVLGLGPLNYQINHAVELLVNRAQQATMEGSMNLWQANNATTREAAQQILLKHNGILPEGLSLVPDRFEANFSGILNMIQFFRQAGSKNARGVTPNDGQKNDQLEVQAISEMNQGASMTNNRTSNWYDYLDRMWSEAFSRLTNPFIDPEECGYSEIMDFQDSMKRRGIPLFWLQRANVSVKAVRLVGDGLRHKELEAASYLTTNRNQFAPEVQPKITRLCTGLVLDNYSLAEELTPIQEEPDAPQQLRADSENAIMLAMRKQLAPNADDIDELHVMAHFPAMEMLISDGLQFQNAAFTHQQKESFLIIGAHIHVHINRIEGRAQNSIKDPEREKAMAMMQQLNQLAAMGDKLSNNLDQQQEGQQQQPIDPIEMARLQLDSQKLQLQREKLGHSVEKFQRTQGFREQGGAFEQMLKLEKDRRESINANTENKRKDLELAVKVASAGQGGNGSQ